MNRYKRKKLRNAGLLYAIHQRYTEQDKETIINGGWLLSVLPAHPAFAFLRAGFSCTSHTQDEIYQYVTTVRDGQRYPLIFMDIKAGHADDRSGDFRRRLVGFDVDGSLRTHEGVKQDKQYNIFHHPLEEILQRASKK